MPIKKRILHKGESDLFQPNSPESGYAAGPETGLFQGNGDIYTSFWNEAHELTWSVGKTDVWDRRYFGDAKPVTTLAQIKEIALHGDITQLNNGSPGLPGSAALLYRAYDFPCPKPVGQILIRTPELSQPEVYQAELDTGSGELNLTAKKGLKTFLAQSFVSAKRNLVVIQGRGENLTSPLRIELYRHRDTLERGKTVMEMSGSYGPFEYDYDQDPGNGPFDPPETGTDGSYFWIRQEFPPDSTFPQGFEVVMMAVIAGAEYDVTLNENILGAGAKVPFKQPTEREWQSLHGAWKEKRLAIEMVNNAPGCLASARISNPGSPFTAYISVMTTRDSADPFSAAKRELDTAVSDGVDELSKENNAWWNQHWANSSVETGNPDFDRSWSSSVYRLGWSARSGKVPINNISQYVFTDTSPWHGDYHFNEIRLFPHMISNQARAILPWLEMLEEMLPMAQANAREVYSCRGCCYTLVHYPIKGKRVVYANQVWELGLELTAMTVSPFWQYYKYTGDRAYLRDHAYPVLREAARFYADYVTLEDDGRYHIVPTVSQENWGITKNFELNRDSVGALSQVRYHFLACVEAAETLGLDSEERETWRRIAGNFAPFPTFMTEDGPIFVDVAGNKPASDLVLFADLSMVFWGDQIHLESDPDLLETARRTFNKMYRQSPDPKLGTLARHPYYYRALERRLGLPRTLAYFDVEDLLMSYTGRMYFFPGCDDIPDVRFDRLLAFGGFEVSAEKHGGTVRNIQITSRAGEPCRIQNPWPGRAPVVVAHATQTQIPTVTEADTISFPTTPGETYWIRNP